MADWARAGIARLRARPGARLVAVSGTVSAIAFAVACLAVRGVEPAPVARGAAEA